MSGVFNTTAALFGLGTAAIVNALKPPPTQMSPQEVLAYNQGESYLTQYKSGQLAPADKVAVKQADANSTASILQTMANAGMSSSTTQFALTGYTQDGQAGGGSEVDMQKASNTQSVLSSYLQDAIGYLGVASGDAAAMASVNLNQSQQIIGLMGAASQSFGSILGSMGGGIPTGYFQPGYLPSTASVPAGGGDQLTVNLPSG